MQITIRDNVESCYVGRITTRHVAFYDASWVAVLRLLAGRTLQIDTKFLFRDQLNTEGLPGDEVESLLATLSENAGDKTRERCRNALTNGIRVFHWMHSGVDGDIRHTRQLCRWCHHHSDAAALTCENCGKSSHFEALS
jgi:hypothetical protein